MGLSAHQSASAKTVEWLTPRWILEMLGEFDLDPCAPGKRPWPTAREHYSLPDDGLSLPWYGRVWLNPPFGREADRWLAKMAAHGDGIALVPARTETRAWFNYIWSMADGILFLKGRPHFCWPDGSAAEFNSGAPIALIAYGPHNAAVLASCRRSGAFVRPNNSFLGASAQEVQP